jgi:hypothetical protein
MSDESAEIMPVVTSWMGVPLMGFMVSKTRRPQQFIAAKIVTRMNPRISNCSYFCRKAAVVSLTRNVVSVGRPVCESEFKSQKAQCNRSKARKDANVEEERTTGLESERTSKLQLV